MTDKKPQLIQTSDGSHSVYLPWMKETYHSSHGAITESEHVFIKNGLYFYLETVHSNQIKLFEIGFGTGLNAFLSLLFSEKNNCKIIYHSIEGFPLAEDIYRGLNYEVLLKTRGSFQKLHTAPWNENVKIGDNFSLKKIQQEWLSFTEIDNDVDIIFYDAFAPSKQPEMWSAELLLKCFRMLKPGGILVTYCAQGQFKRNLRNSGFEVETLPGPPGKKEMVRGIKR